MDKLLSLTVTKGAEVLTGLSPQFTVFTEAGAPVTSGTMVENTLKPGVYHASPTLAIGSYLVEYYDPASGYKAFEVVEVADGLSIAGDVAAILNSLGPLDTATVQAKLSSLATQLSDHDTQVSTSLAAIQQSLNNMEPSAVVVPIVPTTMSRPLTGTKTYRLFLHVYDENGTPEQPDVTPTVEIVNGFGTTIQAHIAMTQSPGQTGVFYFDFVLSDTSSLGVFIFEFHVVENAIDWYVKRVAEVVLFGSTPEDLQTLLGLIYQDTHTLIPNQITACCDTMEGYFDNLLGAGFDTGQHSLTEIMEYLLTIPNNPLRENDIRLPWPPTQDNELATRVHVYDTQLTALDVWSFADRRLTGPVLLDNPQAAKLNSIPSNPLLVNDPRLPLSGILPTYTQMVNDTLQASGVWANPVRTLTQTISLSPTEHDHLMSIPLNPLLEDDWRLPLPNGTVRLLNVADIATWAISPTDIWTHPSRTLTGSALLPAELAQLMAIPLDPFRVGDARLPAIGETIATIDDVVANRLTATQVWGAPTRTLTSTVTVDPAILNAILAIPTNPFLASDPRLPLAGILAVQSDVTSAAVSPQDIWTYGTRSLTTPVIIPTYFENMVSDLPQDVWTYSSRTLTQPVMLDPGLLSHLQSLPSNPLLETDPRLPTSGVIPTTDDLNAIQDLLASKKILKVGDGNNHPFSYLSGIVSAGYVNFSFRITNDSNSMVELTPADFDQQDLCFLRLPMEFLQAQGSIVVADGPVDLAATYGLLVYDRGDRMCISWLTESGKFKLNAGQTKTFSVTMSHPYLSIFESWSQKRYFDEVLQGYYTQVQAANTMAETVAPFALAKEYLRGLGVSLKELTYGKVF